MKSDLLEELLDKHQLRKTIIRKEILKLFILSGSRAMSSSEIEKCLDDPDRITLYRTLKSFEEKGLIHQAIDTSGTTKYAYCQQDCTVHAHHDEHAHFHCISCDKTICLENPVTQKVTVPSGYQITSTHLVIEGKCVHCNI